jgi:thermitase
MTKLVLSGTIFLGLFGASPILAQSPNSSEQSSDSILDFRVLDPHGKASALPKEEAKLAALAFQNINSSVQLRSYVGKFDGTGGCVPGGTYRVSAQWLSLAGSPSFTGITAQVVELSGGNVLLQQSLVDATADNILSPGETLYGGFSIWLRTCNSFRFYINLVGATQPAPGPDARLGLPVSFPNAFLVNTPTLFQFHSVVSGSVPVIDGTVQLEVTLPAGGAPLVYPMDDSGAGADRVAGDNIYSTQFSLNLPSPGVVQIRASALFQGISGRIYSEVAKLEAFPAGTPLETRQPDLSKTVASSLGVGSLLCNEVIANVPLGTPVSSIQTMATSVGGTLVGLLPGETLHSWQIQIPCNGADGVNNAISTLSQNPLVRSAEANGIVASNGVTPNDPSLASQWGLGATLTDKAWAITRGGLYSDKTKSWLIAIVDTGVDYNHPDLAGRVIKGRDFINSDDDPMDDHGHGTHVAGIAGANAGNGVGIAGVTWRNQLLAVKSLGSDGKGSDIAIAAGIKYAVDHGALIISLSIGSNGRSEAVAKAIDRANKAGRLVVAAAGNDYRSWSGGPGGFNPTENFGGRIYDTRLVTVGANDSNLQAADFSNYGRWVELYAPGVNILSTLPGNHYGNLSGTSMATPLVSGIAALIASGRTNFDRDWVERNLLTALDSYTPAHVDKDNNPIFFANAYRSVFQAFARACTACPEAPTVYVTRDSVSLGIDFRGGPIIPDPGAGAPQARSVHGISVPIEAPGPLGQYDVNFLHALYTWDAYTPGNLWDSFSVSVSQNPYWLLSLADPLATKPGFSLGKLWGGTARGVKNSDLGIVTVTMSGSATGNWLNFVIDTATLPNSDNSFPTWGVLQVYDITPK